MQRKLGWAILIVWTFLVPTLIRELVALELPDPAALPGPEVLAGFVVTYVVVGALLVVPPTVGMRLLMRAREDADR